jgi:tRNA nucleotidyltransferase (CCA-adding enzyme)
MFDTQNLRKRLAEALPPEVNAFLRVAAKEAAKRKWRLYLVGGTVRDLLLERPGFDIDLSVEGDAIELARAIAASPGDITVHHRFNTARVTWGNHHIDLARSREETYARPGALPTVRPGSIENDLFRRDFTVNAMAIPLDQDDWGRLIDLNGGADDLRNGVIRILQPKSFIDDATRIWRAVRYEQRLDFYIEPTTLKLLGLNRDMLRTITADRLRYEMECILAESKPEKVFSRADELGILATWHPSLRGDSWISDACARARAMVEKPTSETYLALLGWRLNANEKEELIAELRLTKLQGRALRDSTKITENIANLASATAKPSSVYAILHGIRDDALIAAEAALDSPFARQNIDLFMTQWRRVTPELTGEDLGRMGVSRGPDIKTLLEELKNLHLDRMISSRPQEESFVSDWLKDHPHGSG